MKTIEKRAKEYMPDAFDEDEVIPAREGYIVNVGRLAYIAGATDQKKIDVKKACKILNEFTDGRLGATFMKQFRKALEGGE